MKAHHIIWILVLVALCALDLVVSGGLLPVGGVLLWKIRIPRMMAAAIAGGSLSLAGTQMQALFRNPLSDPHIMGVSGGAGLGAAIAALAVTGSTATMVSAAFLGALLTGILVVWIASRIKSTGTLLLTGVMLGFIFSAISSILQYSATEESLKLYYSWMAGSFGSVGKTGLAVMGGALLAGLLLAVPSGKGLDLVLFGDDFATLSGLPLKRLRFRVMLGCALLAGSVTAFCGPIGFVGIVAPHIVRRLEKTSVHRVVTPLATLCGASLSVAADVIAHIGPYPLPVGSTMAIIGIPIVLTLLWRKKI
ncbi:MAG: iron ABC transporter permease [Bacteroidales bacterium]|nr:iron ABC transporter permease [Bacteroidales bacterium]